MTFSNNPEKLSLFGGGCNENDRILDLYGGLEEAQTRLGIVTSSTWRRSNETRHRNQFNMAAYGQSSFLLSRSARRLNVVAQEGPIPTVNEKTMCCGTKLAPSTSRTPCSHSRLLLRSCFAYWLTRSACKADGALGWKTLTSKSDRLKRSPQNPRALMSRRASWVALADRRSCSPLSGCRGGSIATSLQTSCSTLAVKSRSSLCRIAE